MDTESRFRSLVLAFGMTTLVLAGSGIVSWLDSGAAADRRSGEVARISAAVATILESEADLTPETAARLDELTGATIRFRSSERTIDAEGERAGTRAGGGVPIEAAPGWRVDAWIPAARGSWPSTTVVAAAVTAGVVVLVGSRRSARDQRRLRRELRGLLGGDTSNRTRSSGDRVSLPETRSMQSIVLPLNDLLLRWSKRLDSLDRHRRRHDLVMDSITSGVIVLDGEGTIDGINPAARLLFDVTTPNPRGLALSDAIQEADIHDLVAIATSTGESQRRTFPSTRSPDKQERELAAAVAPILDARPEEARSPAGVVILVEDATDLRRLERARTEFVGNVSHELRTPLTNLLGYLSTVRDMVGADEPVQVKFLATAERNAIRLARIIEDLLDLAKLEGGEELEREPVRVRPLLDRIAERHRVELAEDPRTIEVQCPPDMEILGAASLLDQAIDNLVSNALRYGSPSGVVRIRVVASSSDLEISVADDGPGIPPRHLPRLFERFYRVDTARSRETGGTGLGLAIVKHIAAAHGGNVRAESVQGIGSTFILQLPLPVPETARSPEGPTADPDSPERHTTQARS